MNKRWLQNMLLAMLIIAIYLVENLSIFVFSRSAVFIYYVKPLIYILVIFIVFKLPKVKPSAKVKYKNFLKEWVLYLAGFYILVNFFAGVFLGFGKSPYSSGLKGIAQNYFLFFSVLIGKEFVRSYIVNNGGRKPSSIKLVSVTIVFTLINVSLNRVFNLTSNIGIMQFIGETVLVQLSLCIFANYLVYLSGAYLSIFYIGIVQGVQYISPILPNLNWIANAAIGILSPVFSLMFLQYIYLKKSKKLKKKDEEHEKPGGWILTAVFSVAMIWFCVGVFPLYPKVVATGSMKPMIHPGDMVVIRKSKNSEVKVGDVVQYKKDNIFIFHRIIDIKKEKDGVKYQTKGDNNTVPDSDLVSIDMIKGKVIKVVPKVGWPTLLIKDRSNKVPKEKVEF